METLTRRAIRLLPVGILIAVAVGASAASAKLPELGRCRATESGTGGKYSDGACIVKAHRSHGVLQGGFEWTPMTGQTNALPLTLEGPMKFETASGARVECLSQSPNDQNELIEERHTLTPQWTLEECSSEGSPCHSAVSIEETEITNQFAFDEEAAEEGQPRPGWAGTLGLVSKGAEPVVGIAYLVKNHERAYPPISCAGGVGTIWIGGDPRGKNTFTSTIGPVDEMTTAFTENLSESAPGIISPAKVMGAGKASFEAFRENKWEPVAIVGTWHEPVEEGELSMEIKALP
jgi:hypothetical protein